MRKTQHCENYRSEKYSLDEKNKTEKAKARTTLLYFSPGILPCVALTRNERPCLVVRTHIHVLYPHTSKRMVVPYSLVSNQCIDYKKSASITTPCSTTPSSAMGNENVFPINMSFHRCHSSCCTDRCTLPIRREPINTL